MNTTNLENCKKLYELSGWGRASHLDDLDWWIEPMPIAPKYDSGYLEGFAKGLKSKPVKPSKSEQLNTNSGVGDE